MIKWLIEKSKIDESYLTLAEEVKRQGMVSIILDYNMNTNYHQYFNEINDTIVFQGGMFFALHLLKNYKCIPCAWLTLDNYKCSTYYAHLGKYLINDNYTIMPVNEIPRRIDYLFRNVVNSEVNTGLFIRPDSGLKLFNAKVHYKESFNDSFSFISLMTNISTLAIVSPERNIKTEWRFVCAEGEIITGCQYRNDNETSIQEGYPNQALELAKEIAKVGFHPDPMYTIDICYCNGVGYRLVELNSFSCAGLYACDLKKIVTTASRLAEIEWKENWNIPLNEEIDQ